MAVRWLQELEAQGAIVARLRLEAPEILARKDLTLDQALILLRLIQKNEQDLDQIVSQMRDADLQKPFFDAADALREIYHHHRVAAEKKVRILRRLLLVVVSD